MHLSVTGLLSNEPIATATLSDQAGMDWYYPTSSDPNVGHDELEVNESGSDTSADMYFAPYRDETDSPSGVSTATDMTLRVTYANAPGVQYVTQFPGAAWQTSQLSTPALSSYVTYNNIVSDAQKGESGQQLATDLINDLTADGGAPGTILLPANTVIPLDTPLVIPNSVNIEGVSGSPATLLFTAADWSSTTQGAISLYGNIGYRTVISVGLENVNIQFTSSGNSWYDPETFTGGPYAVLYLTNTNSPPVELNLSDVSITGPPAFDAHPTTQPESPYTYIGEPATNLIWTASGEGWTQDSGTITGSTFQGGTILLSGGPWSISNDVDLGALPGTYSLAAFSARGSMTLGVGPKVIPHNRSCFETL